MNHGVNDDGGDSVGNDSSDDDGILRMESPFVLNLQYQHKIIEYRET